MNRIIILFAIGFLIVGCQGTKDAEFEWNFKKNKGLTYAFDQKVTTAAEFSNQEEPRSMSSNVTFDLEMNFDGGDKAKLKMKNAKLIVEGEPISDVVPELEMEDMDNRGKFESQNLDALFDILMALPKKDLKVGNSDKIEVKFPFAMPDSTYTCYGVNTITFVKTEERESVNCAILKGDIVFKKAVFDIGQGSSYSFGGSGTADYAFDIENGCFSTATIDMHMEANWDTAPQSDTTNQITFSHIKMNSKYAIALQSIR